MPKPDFPPCKLLTRTIEMLRNRPEELTLQRVAADTNTHHRWLESILLPNYNGSPSVCRIVALYEYLTQSTLTIK